MSNKPYFFLYCAFLYSWITFNLFSAAFKIETLKSYSSKIFLLVSLETRCCGQVQKVKQELDQQLWPSLQVATYLGMAIRDLCLEDFQPVVSTHVWTSQVRYRIIPPFGLALRFLPIFQMGTISPARRHLVFRVQSQINIFWRLIDKLYTIGESL